MRVIIVEDDRMLLGNLRLLLDGESGITVVATYGNSEDALKDLPSWKIDVLLADIGLPDRSGIELIREVRRSLPDVDILAHTIFDNRDTVYAAIKAGASGYVLKGATPRELVEALHDLHQGGAPMSPRIARAVIRDLQEAGVDEQYLLSPREREILLRLEKGLTYTEVGTELCISPHTVHTHVKNIYEKLHATGRRDALLKARKKGVI
jgi:DNA-binding NarL/FixJ family response regulator